MSINSSWQRILAWYQPHVEAEELSPLNLRGPASEEEIQRLEGVLGVELPEDVKAFYRLHDGTGSGYLAHFGNVMSLQEIEAVWKRYCQWQKENGYGLGADWEVHQLEAPEVKRIFWNPLRIPLTDNGGGDPNLIDMDPTKHGTLGQIIHQSHEVGPTDLLAPSFAAWLEQIADDLEAGVYVYDEDGGQVLPADWLAAWHEEEADWGEEE